MTEIRVIAPLDATFAGPVARRPEGQDQPVHLRQGTLDGACGPCVVFMAMIVCGIADRDDLLPRLRRDGRGRVARVFRVFERTGALFQGGMDVSAARSVLAVAFGRRVREWEPALAMIGGPDASAFVRDAIERGDPVLLKLSWGDSEAGGSHWVLAIGLEYERWTEAAEGDLCRILVLDPDLPAPAVSAWNGVVDARPDRDGGLWWWSRQRTVRVDAALAVSPPRRPAPLLEFLPSPEHSRRKRA